MNITVWNEHVHESRGDEIVLGSTTLKYVERTATDSLLEKVTISPTVTETPVMRAIAPML